MRKTKVLKALMWLKEHNQECQDIELKIKNVDWMGADEGKELQVSGDSISCETKEEKEKHISVEKDLGPNVSSNHESLDAVCGLHEKNGSGVVNAKDISLKESI